MLVGQDALEAIEARLEGDEKSRSAYWVAEMDTFSINAAGDFQGTALLGNLGGSPDLLRNVAHWLLQTPIRRMGRHYGNIAECLRLTRAIAKAQNRQFTHDFLRQALSLALIREHLPELPKDTAIAVIGDGFGVMTTLLRRCWPNNQVIVCNLNKPLLVDLTFACKADPTAKIALAENEEDMAAALNSSETEIIGLRADNMPVLAHAPISLAINILSMQEMPPQAIEGYFSALRLCPSQQTSFYCANRLQKTLHDGSIVSFLDYPWRSNDQIYFHEICEWSQIIYQKLFPFWRRRGRGDNKLVVHRLANLEKENFSVS